MEIGMCTEDDKHWKLTEILKKKQIQKQIIELFKIQNFIIFGWKRYI